MSGRRKLSVILVMGLILVLPILLTFCLHTGKNHYRKLPILGPVEVSKQGDTTYHKIRSFTLYDQKGRKISLEEDLKDKFFLVNFFYSECPGHCPEMMKKLKHIKSEYDGVKDFKILSISVTPSKDSIEKLRRFAEKMDIKGKQWHLLTGDKENVFNLVEKGFLVPIEKNNTAKEKNRIHSDLLVLVDKEGRIRGYYKGTKREDFNKLKDEIAVLSVEYAKRK